MKLILKNEDEYSYQKLILKLTLVLWPPKPRNYELHSLSGDAD